MRVALFSIPFLFFSLISGASDARTQLQNVRDTISTVTQSRGVASAEVSADPTVAEVSTEASVNETTRYDYFRNQNVSLTSGNETAYYPPTRPAGRRTPKKPVATPPAEGSTGTGQ